MPDLHGPAVWNSADISRSTRWRIDLDAALVRPLAEAAKAAAAAAPASGAVDRSHFDCPEAAGLCDRIHDELENGVGFAVLGGLPYETMGYEQQLALTLGLCDHVGQVVPQNYDLDRIVDVRDEGIEYSHRSRGYRSNKFLPFHTDGAHLFALACLDVAAEGGETIIVSASAVYNRLAEENPQALEVLCRGFYHHRRGQHDPGEPPLSTERIPVFAFHKGLLHCCYNRNPIDWAEKEGIRLSPAEVAALDAIDGVLGRSDMQLRLNLKPGECAFVNNFITMHSRTEYRDGPDRRRHMLRVWMHDPKSRRGSINLLHLYVPGQHASVG